MGPDARRIAAAFEDPEDGFALVTEIAGRVLGPDVRSIDSDNSQDAGDSQALPPPEEAPLRAPRNKGGRPRKKPSEILSDVAAEPMSEEALAEYCAAAFAIVEVASQHGFWHREAQECMPIAKPLAKILARMNPQQLKWLQERSDWVALAGGCCLVAGPAAMKEWEEYRERRTGGGGGRAVESRGDSGAVEASRYDPPSVQHDGDSIHSNGNGKVGIRLPRRPAQSPN